MADSLLADLVSWWSLDEASGQRADAHGTNHLADNNTVGSAVGKVGNAASFVQVDDEKLSIADVASLSMGAGVEWTIAAWVYPTEFPSNGHAIVTKGGSLEYFIDATTGGVMRLFIGGGAVINDGGTISTGEWSLVTVWYDGSVYRVSLNDSSPVSSPIVGSTPDGPGTFMVGGRSDAGGFGWNGLIDETAVWKRSLTADERSRLYNGGSGIGYSDLLSTGPVLRSPHALNYLDPSAVLSSPFLIGSLR